MRNFDSVEKLIFCGKFVNFEIDIKWIKYTYFILNLANLKLYQYGFIY